MLEEMSENDREILFLRHFEQLSNNDVADVLGISATTASNRYIRALQRLKELLPHYEY
jgi:RNA polymerase sigma-70 factor (ECF subfamily)